MPSMSDFTRIGVAVLVAAGACWTPAVNAAAGETYGPTGPNDTLWSIAVRLRPEGATMEQTMLALTRINPDAFVGPQGNLVMAGATLRAPTLSEAQAVTAAQAALVIDDPEANWAEALGLAGVEEDAAVALPAPASPAPAAAQPADQGTLGWRVRAEDAELRVAELERASADLQAQLDEQAAVAARAERRVAQLEAQVARKPRSTSPFAKRDEPDPMLFWSGLGGAGFLLLLIGLLLGRRRGRPRSSVKGVAAKPRVSARPVADFAAAEALGEADSDVVGPVRVAGTVGARPPGPASPPPSNQGVDVGRASFSGPAAPPHPSRAPTAPATPVSAPVPPRHGADDSLQVSGPAAFDNAGMSAAAHHPGDARASAPRLPDVDATADAASPDMERAPGAAYATTTKLNLARAYVDLNDRENARAVCLEVMREGNDAEREVAKALLQRLDEPTR